LQSRFYICRYMYKKVDDKDVSDDDDDDVDDNDAGLENWNISLYDL